VRVLSKLSRCAKIELWSQLYLLICEGRLAAEKMVVVATLFFDLRRACRRRFGREGPRAPIAESTLGAREWLTRSMIAAEAPGWRGATKASE
jgi:hypothetical protein